MSRPLTTCFPRLGSISAQEAVEQVTAPPPGGRLTTGDERIRVFLSGLAQRWLEPRLVRRFPELAPLGFFLRRAEGDRLLAPLAPEATRLFVPRGLVVHFPPSNVETISVYSWALSALAGNSNIVRVSSRSGELVDVVLESLKDALADAHPAVASTQLFVSYGRDEEATGALSAGCDLRAIWGGDASVDAIRRHPLRPGARDLTFPDRSSFAVIGAAAWLAARHTVRRTVSEGFYNDSYWFDQAACSSPRALFWVGDEPTVQAARMSFREQMRLTVEARRPVVDTAMAIEKRVAAYGLAVEARADAIRFISNALTFTDLVRPDAVPRTWLGVGTFCESRLDSLSDLAPLMTRRDQTVSYFGFTPDELRLLALELGGYGVNRIVPIGSALRFTATWDGYDLMREFTRILTVQI
ncbi:hypothetical protein OIE52_50805 [Streptomyces canus]|uniref:acyl-CoA reductase n=1 Tax=Streptomyces canus TaxID=58343 RepID=UPI0030DE9D33